MRKQPWLLARFTHSCIWIPVSPRMGKSSGIPSDEDRPSPPSDPRLADVVSARLALSRLFNVSSSSPWICFGGSYAGSLAAWARLKVLRLLRVGWGEGTRTPGPQSQIIEIPSHHYLPPAPQEFCTSCPHKSPRSHSEGVTQRQEDMRFQSLSPHSDGVSFLSSPISFSRPLPPPPRCGPCWISPSIMT